MPRGAGAGPAVAAAWALCLLFGVCAPARAQIYASRDMGSGAAIVLSNFASESTPVLVVAGESDATPANGNASARASEAPATPTGARTADARPAATRRSSAFDGLLARVADEVGLSRDLLAAVAAQESNFDPRAVSSKGAMGLMQLRPDTAARFEVKRPFDPYENLLGGAQYLRWLSTRFADRIDLVLAGYNAGEQAVLRAGGRVPDYPETQAYVTRILRGLNCRGVVDCRVRL